MHDTVWGANEFPSSIAFPRVQNCNAMGTMVDRVSDAAFHQSTVKYQVLFSILFH